MTPLLSQSGAQERFAGSGLENIRSRLLAAWNGEFSPDFYDATARREMLATCGLNADAKL
jgi:hypothetical protein